MRRMLTEKEIGKYGVTTDTVASVLEGSDSVVVDLNEEGDKLQVRLDQDYLPKKIYRHFVECTHTSSDFGEVDIAFEIYSTDNTAINAINKIPTSFINKPIMCINFNKQYNVSTRLIPQVVTFTGTHVNLECLELKGAEGVIPVEIGYATNCDETRITLTDTVFEI